MWKLIQLNIVHKSQIIVMCEVRKKGVTSIAQTNENSTDLHRLNVGVNQQDHSLYDHEKKDSYNRMQQGTGLKLSHHLVPHFSTRSLSICALRILC